MNVLSYKTLSKCEDTGTRNEDVFMADRRGSGCSKFIVADGATTGFSGGRFAYAVAWSFMSTPQNTTWRKRLKLAWERFDSQVDYRKLNWFQRRNYERGSFSTMLTGEVVRDGILLTAVGDTCAFVVDKCSLAIKRSFPVECSYDFTVNPYLLGSHDESWLFEPRWRKVCWHHVLLKEDDMCGCWLLCATDAVSEYVLGHREDPECVRGLIGALHDNRSFAAWVKKCRDAKALRVDDSTAVLIDPA